MAEEPLMRVGILAEFRSRLTRKPEKQKRKHYLSRRNIFSYSRECTRYAISIYTLLYHQVDNGASGRRRLTGAIPGGPPAPTSSTTMLFRSVARSCRGL